MRTGAGIALAFPLRFLFLYFCLYFYTLCIFTRAHFTCPYIHPSFTIHPIPHSHGFPHHPSPCKSFPLPLFTLLLFPSPFPSLLPSLPLDCPPDGDGPDKVGQHGILNLMLLSISYIHHILISSSSLDPSLLPFHAFGDGGVEWKQWGKHA